MKRVILCRYKATGKYFVICKKCAATQGLPSPLDAVNWLHNGDAFEAKHKDCKGRKNQIAELPMFEVEVK